MKEIEVKILGVDIEAVREKLVSLDSKLLFDGTLKMRLFDYSDGRIRKNGGIMRLYQEGEKTLFVFKKKQVPLNGCKNCDEIEVEVADFEGTSKFLKTLGFVLCVERVRRRTSYYFQNIHFDLDIFSKDISYMEIEAETPEKIEEGIQLLSLEGYEKSSESIDELFKRLF